MQALFRQDRRVLGAYARRNANLSQFRAASSAQFVSWMQQVGAVRRDIAPQVAAYIMTMLSYALISMDDQKITGACQQWGQGLTEFLADVSVFNSRTSSRSFDNSEQGSASLSQGMLTAAVSAPKNVSLVAPDVLQRDAERKEPLGASF